MVRNITKKLSCIQTAESIFGESCNEEHSLSIYNHFIEVEVLQC